MLMVLLHSWTSRSNKCAAQKLFKIYSIWFIEPRRPQIPSPLRIWSEDWHWVMKFHEFCGKLCFQPENILNYQPKLRFKAGNSLTLKQSQTFSLTFELLTVPLACLIRLFLKFSSKFLNISFIMNNNKLAEPF